MNYPIGDMTMEVSSDSNNVYSGLGSIDTLADVIYRLYRERFPKVVENYGEYEITKTMEDIVYHLQYLDESVKANDVKLFSDYVSWIRVLFKGLGLPAFWIKDSLLCIRDVMGSDKNQRQAVKHIDSALMELEGEEAEERSFLDAQSPYYQQTNSFCNYLIVGKRQEARKLVMEMLESGMSVRELYLQVFQPSMYEIGRLWQTKKISVAQEHYSTAATSLIMAELYPRIYNEDRKEKNMMATSVSGELHEMGIRMVADLFEMEGWNTYFLGASTPKESILDMIKAQGIDLVAISATMTFHVQNVRELIAFIRKEMGTNAPKIIVGGYPFKISPTLWENVGADGFSEDADKAIKLAEDLISI